MEAIPKIIRFEDHKLIGGALTRCVVEGWDWTKDKGSYFSDKNFFSIHWEVHDRAPNSIRLHVEAPRAMDDPVLNSLKHNTVTTLLQSDIQQLTEQKGYGYKNGRMVSGNHIGRNKSTEPFRVILTEIQTQGDNRQNLQMVHDAFGLAVNATVDNYFRQLSGLGLSPITGHQPETRLESPSEKRAASEIGSHKEASGPNAQPLSAGDIERQLRKLEERIKASGSPPE